MFEEDDDLLDKISAELRGGIPQPVIDLEGQYTVIRNYQEILSVFNRDSKHLRKYLSSEWGAKVKVKGDQLFIQKKLTSTEVLSLLESYATNYIYCPNCGKPDTILRVQKKSSELHCLSCGHRVQIK